MKFRHEFKCVEKKPSYRVFSADESNVRIDFFEHMIRVAVLREGENLLPTFSVCPAPCVCGREGRDKLSTEGLKTVIPEVAEREGGICFKTDEVSIDIDLLNFRMRVSNDNGILYEDREYIAYNFGHELGRGSKHFITREDDEKIFGLGDKTGHVNKNRMSFKLGAADAMGFDARSSDPLYKQLPFYICENSTGSYGIYYDTYSCGEISFGKEINNYYAPYKYFGCDEENLVFYVIFGKTDEILRRFSKLCGPIMFPPKWSLRYCGSTMAYTDAPDADRQLREFVRLCEEYGLKPGGFYLSSGYTQIGEKRYVFHWNKDKIPSPEGLAAYYKEHGIEFLPNIKPAFLTDHPLYEEIASHGWFLHYADNTPAVFPFWSGYGSYLDFTNPEAFDFWTACVKKNLVDRGYKCTWNDNNEYDICDEEVYAAGFGYPVRACTIRPLFSLLMTMASLKAQDDNVRKYAVSRCGVAGLQRIASTWTGDNHTGFDDFRYNHYMAMTMSMSGLYNFGQDIGGFAGPRPQKELLLRWIQYGIFTPRFVLHSWNPDKTSTMPWLYPEAIPVVKRLFDLRERLIPYLYNEVYRSVTTHDPIIYPLFLKHPGYDTESDCFYFGDEIIACPVFDEGVKKVTVKLPENNGGWYFEDCCYSGELTIPCDCDDLPVWFVKGGSVLPVEGKTGLRFVVYPLKMGEFKYSFLSDDGKSELTEDNHEIIEFRVVCAENTEVYVKSKNKLDIRLTDKLNRALKIIYE